MGFIEIGALGLAIYSLVNQNAEEIVEAIEGTVQSAIDEVRNLQQGYVQRQKQQPGYQKNCTVNFLWKWADTRNWHRYEYEPYKNHFIVQSCGVLDKDSTVPTAIAQIGGNNGVADDHPLEPHQNGGLNPILSSESFSYFRNGQQGQFSNSERLAAKELLASNNVSADRWPFVIRTTKAVGFERLSEYHWIASIDHALMLLQSSCEAQVTVKFHCASETNKWYDGEWQRRIDKANGTYFREETGEDPNMLVDYRGDPVHWSPIFCGVDNTGESIWSIPLRCGEERTFWHGAEELFRNGPCRNLFARLSTEFSHPEQGSNTRYALTGADALPRVAD